MAICALVAQFESSGLNDSGTMSMYFWNEHDGNSRTEQG